MSDDPVGLGDEMSEGTRDDLVKRLRSAEDLSDFPIRLCREAADRIEALQLRIIAVVTERDQAADRNEALEDALQRFNRSYDEMCSHHEKRIEALEAVLREIAECEPPNVTSRTIEIARRALERKP
jgi:hypothetical protein